MFDASLIRSADASRPRHGPLDRMLRSCMAEFIADRRAEDPPISGLHAAAVDLVAFARDTDRAEFGAAVMTLVVMLDCGPSALRGGLYALLDAATRSGLDRQSVIPSAAMSELPGSRVFTAHDPDQLRDLAAMLTDLEVDIPIEDIERWTAEDQYSAWTWATRSRARAAVPPDVPGRPKFLKRS